MGKGTSLAGNNILEKSLVRQWLQYQEQMLGGDTKNFSTLQIMNRGLADRTFLAGENISFADFLLFFRLQSTMKELAYQEKESIVNISRWFVHLQTVISSGSDSVLLSRTRL